jgi:16S rRNA (guanine527-N7)-methyltransferase
MIPVSRETGEVLAVYVDLLQRWQAIKNLVGPSTLPHVWTRHIADSAQLLDFAPASALTWVDMGSGAGFPGLVLAILLRQRPGARVHLVESNGRKCAFLREVIRATGAPAEVHSGRIEAVVPKLCGVDVVTARALAPLPDLLTMALPLLRAGTIGLFLKGDEAAAEVAQVENGSFADIAVKSMPSVTHSGGRIIVARAKVPSDGSMTRGQSE